MENRITEISFYKPLIEDLWFREAMMADPETMSYNNAWGGTIPFPREKWAEWYDFWVKNPDKRFYRYIATGKSRSFVGEAAYHYDEDLQVYLADIIVSAKCRKRGYGKAGLQKLCAAAKAAGIPEMYDNIARDNPGIRLFLQCGFREEYRTEEIIMLKKQL
ncbi:MAG: GNAT family N-acetyltransferase [Clostridiales bacterium]|nr:GNAT family N-acetyltransferase [Clostridiales bacterium]